MRSGCGVGHANQLTVFRHGVRENYFQYCAGMSELADEADLKSAADNCVWVQIPLPALSVLS